MRRPYWKYLQSYHWVQFRAYILGERESCEICKSHRADQVHHLTYERLGAELDSDVVAICRPCHAGVHAKWGEILGMGGDQLVTQVVFALMRWRVTRGELLTPFCTACGQGMGKATPDATKLTILHTEGCPNAGD